MGGAPRDRALAHEIRRGWVGHELVAARDVAAGHEHGERRQGKVPANADGAGAILRPLVVGNRVVRILTKSDSIMWTLPSGQASLQPRTCLRLFRSTDVTGRSDRLTSGRS